MKNNVEYCKKTGKYIYSSEAKASRAMNRYSDIRRYYFCDSCEGFHTTKVGIPLAIMSGIINAPKPIKYVTPEQIQNKIDQLKNSINLKENNNDRK